MADGTLTDQLSGQSPIDKELADLASNSAVDSELARLKADMGGGTAAPSEPAALGSGADAIPDVTAQDPVTAPEQTDS